MKQTYNRKHHARMYRTHIQCVLCLVCLCVPHVGMHTHTNIPQHTSPVSAEAASLCLSSSVRAQNSAWYAAAPQLVSRMTELAEQSPSRVNVSSCAQWPWEEGVVTAVTLHGREMRHKETKSFPQSPRVSKM